MSAIEKALWLLETGTFPGRHEAEVVAARAELAALRAENEKLRTLAVCSDKEGTAFYYRDAYEAQAKQIETMRRALDEHIAANKAACQLAARIDGGLETLIDAMKSAGVKDGFGKRGADALASLPPSDMRLVPVETINARAWQLMDAARPDQTLGDIRGQLVAEFGEDGVERAAAAIKGAE